MIKKLLIVGSGVSAKRHLKVARENLPHADIRVLQRQKPERIPPNADGYFTNLNKAVRYAPQAAIVANPSSHHIKVAIPLAATGCHLLIEKPIANNFKKVDQLIKIASAKKIILQVGYNLRFLPSLLKFKHLVQKHLVGKPLFINCTVGKYLPDWRPNTDYRRSVSARRKLGGGVLLELSHELDYLQWIFGAPKWVSAWLGKLSNLEINVEDSAFLILGFQPPKQKKSLIATLNLDFVRRDTTRTCQVSGSKGSLRWNGLAGSVEMYRPESAKWKKLHQAKESIEITYKIQFKKFLKCIKIKHSTIPDGKNSVVILKTIEAAIQSMKKKKVKFLKNIRI